MEGDGGPERVSRPFVFGAVCQFRKLAPRSFHGLSGLPADCLPDNYGNRLIDVWLARTGRSPAQFNAVDRLCYTGTRGMGALEFEPSTGGVELDDRRLEVAELVELAGGCNLADYVKNFAFIMDRRGNWEIAPARPR
jgi:serine/threonine-protein kinase HipA